MATPCFAPRALAQHPVAELDRWLSGLLVDRIEEARVLVLALLTRQHAVMLGAPGTGKSVLAEALARSIADARSFSLQCSAYTSREEIEGAVDLGELRAGRVVRSHAGRLMASDVAYLDELFRAPSEVLSVALSALNERRAPDGKPIPLWSAVAAANDPPREGLAGAFGDRLLYRCIVRPVQGESLGRLLRGREEELPPAPKLTMADVITAREQVAGVRVTSDVRKIIDRFAGELPALRVELSDRRWSWAAGEADHAGRPIASTVRAAAWLAGRAETTVADVRALAWIAWHEAEHAPAVRELLARLIPTSDAALQRLLNEAKEAEAAACSSSPISGRVVRVADAALAKLELELRKLGDIDDNQRFAALSELNAARQRVLLLLTRGTTVEGAAAASNAAGTSSGTVTL